MFIVMIMVNIHDVKARLSEFLEAVDRGEQVVICKRNQPVAELVPVGRKRAAPRPLEPGAHRFDVAEAFFEPLPSEFLDGFEGAAVYPEPAAAPARVAEPRQSGYRDSRKHK
jgi:prevent-host-death family protein